MKKLKIEQPISNCYQFMAFPLAIQECNPMAYEWIYSNFIQTCFDLSYHKTPVPYYFYIFDYTISPFLDVQKLNRDTLANNNLNILDFIVNTVDNGQYIYLNLDEFYIPKRNAYKDKHFSHDCLIYGYDMGKREIYLYGFDISNQLNMTEISFDDFVLAYENIELIEKELTYINLYKLRKGCKYKLNLDIIIEQLKEYFEGRNSSNRFSMLRETWERAYGIDFYTHINDYILSCESEKIKMDIRIFHFLYEHKYIMKRRIEYLLKTSTITECNLLNFWNEITEEALIIRNKAIKSNLLNEYKYSNLNASIQLLGKKEKAVLEKTIEHMQSCNY